MRKQQSIVAAVLWMIGLAGLGLAAGQAQPPAAPPEVLRALPLGAAIADVPVKLSPDHGIIESRPGLIFADVDGDGQEEAVVAYFTIPGEETDKCASLWSERAHVRVLKRVDGVWRELWDSGGFGSHFQPRMPEEARRSPDQGAYTDTFFSVRDITGDGKPEILFTRSSFLAEGDRFEAWRWNGDCFALVAWVDGMVRVAGRQLFQDFEPKGMKLERPSIYRWDGERFHEQLYVRRFPPDSDTACPGDR